MAGFVLSDLLVADGLLTPKQLEQVRRVMEQKCCPFEEAVLSLELLAKPVLYGAIADQFRVPYVDLEEYQTDPEVRTLIPERIVRQHRVFPLFRIQGALAVAVSDPTNVEVIDALRQVSGCLIEAYLSSEAEILRCIDREYGTEGETTRFLEELASRPVETAPAGSGGRAEGTVSKLLDLIMSQAVRDRASDIHIEPEENGLRIRMRIDGILHDVPSPPKSFEAALISRLKVLADMDIAENRIPQDGHFRLKVDERQMDVRMATLPTMHGENVVLRLLDASGVFLGLEKLGFSPTAMKQFEEVIRKPHGVILSVGPTGSGKTTALYSALMRINSTERNIVTIEDPVEYSLGLIRQMQVHVKAGVTFANGLRAILRQDPDVIMVGEIRDWETAEIVIQAALTGHLVFSTLHTNDAVGTVIRLINMGVEPFLVSASVICIMAQRLVRTLCDSCKGWVEPSEALLKRLFSGSKTPLPKAVRVARAVGCPECKGSGYRGRAGLYELMVLDDDLRERILSNASAVVLREAARAKGMKLLWEEGVAKVLEGVTTLEEVARVTEERLPLPGIQPRPGGPEPDAPPAQRPALGEAPPRASAQAGSPSEDLESYERRFSAWGSNKGKPKRR